MDLLAEQRLLFSTRGSLSVKLRKLEEADRVAAGEALYENPKAKLAPNPEIEKVKAELEAVKQRAEDLNRSIDRAEVELVDVIEDNREAWMKDISPEVDAVYADYEKQIDALAEARKRVREKNSIYWWLHNFSSDDFKNAIYKPSYDSWVVDLKGINHEPYLFSTVTEALRKDAVRVLPSKKVEEYIPWGHVAYQEARDA
jgi:hypothetical protein